MFTVARRALLAGLALMALATPTQADPYYYRRYDVPGAQRTRLTAISQDGALLGYYTVNNAYHGFLQTSGALTPIDAPAGETFPMDLNSAGTVVGLYTDPVLGNRGFMLKQGVFSTIHYPGAQTTQISGINEQEDIAGSFSDGTTDYGIMTFGGSYLPPIQVNSTSTHLSDLFDGVPIAVGYKTAVGDLTGFVYLGEAIPIEIAGSLAVYPSKINNRGQVVGQAFTLGGTRGFSLYAGDVELIHYPGAAETTALGVNTAGQVVGAFSYPNGPDHGFIATPVPITAMADLQTAIAQLRFSRAQDRRRTLLQMDSAQAQFTLAVRKLQRGALIPARTGLNSARVAVDRVLSTVAALEAAGSLNPDAANAVATVGGEARQQLVNLSRQL